MSLDHTRAPNPEQLGQWQVDLLWGMHKKDGLRPAQVELLFGHIAAISQPAPSPTPGEAEAAFARIDEDHVDEQLRCVSCGCDDGHKPTCDMLKVRAAFAAWGSGRWVKPLPDDYVGMAFLNNTDTEPMRIAWEDSGEGRYRALLTWDGEEWDDLADYVDRWWYLFDVPPPPAEPGKAGA